ncbi:hypothetical protein PDE_02727 [Penicillium oxalicum 114-2]|uniref:Phospholipase/carboxylesterase/thioesterase domain-containing protein n=1 Tax=Penicillium oxalicum (strain 114-2 / CGMCC 5302) TaxID=933388 RepID=S8APE0_PENO1|nr:hypothetical protein PDE_02727 [Penicillium oxalicum 114-2]
MDFPSPHVVAPQERHTHTAIFLHGRGSTALEFCEDLLQSTTSQLKSLPDSLPHFRWVFPAAKTLYSTRFQEMQWAWFDVWSLENVEERQELVLESLRESVSHLLAILADEIERVGGDASRVFLCGISQGMATALWTFFCAVGQIKQPLGGLVGFCGWLPFARKVEDLIRRQQAMALLPSSVTGLILADSNGLDNNRAILTLLRDLLDLPSLARIDASTDISILSTPVLLSHGSDDQVVPIRLGRQAARFLQHLNGSTEWAYFSGAEANGHWIKEPDGFDQILNFLNKRLNSRSHS